MIKLTDSGVFIEIDGKIVKLRTEKPNEGDRVLIIPSEKGLTFVKPAPIQVGDKVAVFPISTGEKIAIGIDPNECGEVESNLEVNEVSLQSGIYTDKAVVDDLDEIIKIIDEKWVKSKECPICGTTTWNLPKKIYELHEYGKQFERNHSVYPCFPITCKNCGYTFLMNTLSLGFYPNVRK